MEERFLVRLSHVDIMAQYAPLIHIAMGNCIVILNRGKVEEQLLGMANFDLIDVE